MTLTPETIELIEKKAALYPKNFCGSGFIASVMKDTLTDPTILASVKGEEWVRVGDRVPTCYKIGNWDGLRSDFVFVKNTETGVLNVAQLYSGTMDGNYFEDWYDERDYDIDTPTHWMNIPE